MTSAKQPRPAGFIVLAAVVLVLVVALFALPRLRADNEAAADSVSVSLLTASQRQERLRRQLQDAQHQLDGWGDWYASLERGDPYPGVGPGILRTANTQQALFDDQVTRLHDVPRADGPPIGPYETLVDIASQLRERDIDFMVVPVPPMAAIYPRRALDSAPPGDDIPPFLDWRLRAFYLALEEAGIEVIDLLPTFLNPPDVLEARLAMPEGAVGPSSIDLLYRYQDRHWTALGSHIAADVVARRIERFPWFKGVRATMGQAVVHDSWTAVTRLGRIARRLSVFGALPSDPAAETFLVRQARIEGEQWSLVDTGSPILLIGDSFGSLDHGFQDALLVELGFRVDAITVPGGRPSAQLNALTLRDGGLEGKKLVIWEFTSASFSTWYRWRSVDLEG